MQLSRANLADIVYFLAIARHQSFSRAGLEVGISASALSHAMKGLEARLGVRLLNRTTRSVTLTVAGEELQSLISAPVHDIGQALEALNRLRDEPAGRIRLNVLSDGAELLLGPVLPVFIERYPDIEIDLTVTNKMVDVIGDGHDAGIRFGGTVPEDMIAQRLSPDVAWAVVGTPDYLQRFGTPTHPEDLKQHRCLRIRLGNARLYDWQFMKEGQALEVEVPGTITIDETRIGVALVTRGVGLMYVPAAIVEPYVAAGSLRRVLEDWTHVDPGFHAYYSSFRQVPIGLRLLIELIRELQPMGALPQATSYPS
ncbi:LysR family transcriptional regulator [Pseudomonas alliivorans]|uniref:LysR family transcriptional regulator n=1 Tax=Pseudomonas alliivorans TaxID=2810613 RepID=UPI001AE35461|nr:LysR family transcriptional regulator [Pseudomonas alliivorans]MBP0938506.1 LysR family transcriptional regulator [Pseudomonas alliivorans]MEE4881518.1 LysR family transcriptional regulator [Pseudomonas alliivorans]MEE4930182.1 LysR family transcriptional regulator [Pseudomonas alliivorans]MEE4933353.1 LysR family transcriptional regulator [Pseudomonas alliivorans]MEE4942298.1 LysR family transcriptional regulator [Pseudomonas alliivorans]